MALYVVSHRCPIKGEMVYKNGAVLRAGDGMPKVRWRPGTGGLVVALEPLLKPGDSWVGCLGVTEFKSADLDAYARKLERPYRLVPVRPKAALYDGFYSGYANSFLWPLLHGLRERVHRDAHNHRAAYVEINRQYARVLASCTSSEDTVWIHDFQLFPLARFLRELNRGLRIGFFLHVPWPSADFLLADARLEHEIRWLVSDVLRADLVGFQTTAYLANFLELIRRIFGFSAVEERADGSALVRVEGRSVCCGVFPIGIDAAMYEGVEPTDRLAEYLPRAGVHRVASLDRIDYTKAALARVLAFGRLFEQYPRSRGAVSMFMILDLSRQDLPEYRREKDQIVEAVERANTDLGTPWWQPFFLSTEHWSLGDKKALFGNSDVMVATPIAEGMGIVPKEAGLPGLLPVDGRLVLSRQAGVADQLGRHACLVTGGDPDSIADGLARALFLSRDEAMRRRAAIQHNVTTYTAQRWCASFLDALRAAV